jgi:hypothetical protein
MVGKNCIMRSFIACTLRQSIIRMMKPRRMKWAGHVAQIGEKRNTYRLLVGKPEGKRPLGKPRHRWTILKWISVRWDGVVWYGLD